MNRLYKTASAVVAIILSLTSCETKETLTSDIDGVWIASPEVIISNDSLSVQLVKTFEFIPQEGENISSGSVNVGAMLAIQRYMPLSDSIVAPITVNAVATASAEGEFEAISFDKLILTTNRTSFTFDIDSENIKYSIGKPSEIEHSDLSAYSVNWAEDLARLISPTLRTEIVSTDTLTAVKVKDSILECQLRNNEIVMRLQPES